MSPALLPKRVSRPNLPPPANEILWGGRRTNKHKQLLGLVLGMGGG